MRITLVQNDIIWEHKEANLLFYESIFSGLSGKTDLVVLPEMCTTGFTMKSESLAEYDDESTITSLIRMAESYDFAIAGSFIGKGNREDNSDNIFNRGFFVHPDGKVDFYNKRHLFRMGEEPEHYSPGNTINIIEYRGWKIRLSICYDLRFPVWNRNVDNNYDLLLVTANWPQARDHVWTSLLTARAIENMIYVCGVNRIGSDGMKITYSGSSMLVNAYGTTISGMTPFMEQVETYEINLDELKRFREKFPVWKDADRFEIYD